MQGKRRLLAILIVMLMMSGVQAQQYAVGVRHGASFWMTKNWIGPGSLKTSPGQCFTYDKEVYLRMDSKKWSYEAGFSHYRFDINREVLVNDVATCATQSVNLVDAKISIQYDVTYPLLGYMFPMLGKMKTYVGFATIPRILLEKTRITETGQEVNSKSVSVVLSFSYGHIIPVSKRLSLSSVLSFGAVPYDKHTRDRGDFYNPNRRIAWHTGIQYNL